MLMSMQQSQQSTNGIAFPYLVTPLLLILAGSSYTVATTTSQEDGYSFFAPLTSTSTTHHGAALIAWLQSENNTCGGGYVHPGVEIRRLPYNNNRTYGVYAATDFRFNETLMEIPRDCILVPRQGHVGDPIEAYIENEEDDNGADYYYGRITAVHKNSDTTAEDEFLYDLLFQDGDDATGVALGDFFDFESLPLNCATVRTLADELKLGSSSKFGPYIQYLWETQQPGNELLPSGWSPAGQDLLQELVMSVGEGKNHDVPDGLLETLSDDWFSACNGDPTDEIGMFAATVTVMRAWDERLIPVYDTFNHRNGHWNNVDNDEYSIDDEKVRVYATRNIKAGEQLYISYNTCNDCGGRLDGYGTPEILRDYGFVEEYPRRFLFPGVMGFDLDFSNDEPGAELQLTWLHGSKPHQERSRIWLKQQWTRLYDLNETALAVRDLRIESDHEWSVIVQYHEALVVSLQAAWRAITGSDMVPSNADENACRTDGWDSDTAVCSLGLDRYDDLLDETVEDWPTDRPATCDYFGIYDLNSWESVEVIKSHYQEMEFLVHNTFGKRDTCFDLENTVQICESYRAHYHEMIVHYTARFIERVERVLFVGGGDSMLLHEILKYPTLQKVVGLELDQLVVRASFRHFGTQPHFDNDKVEWWFGDATKTLRILPKGYFGSFDMVLVDLSETVTALSVTDELDVMQALTLLLRPSGILVKNEVMYFPEMKSIFSHTLNIHYYDVPIVCSQALILGSNSVAFPRAKVYDHQIETLLRLLDNPRHEVMHDYQYNSTIDGRFCASNKRDELTQQEASPGIVMIVEADNVESKQVLKSAELLGAALQKELETFGLSVVSRSLLAEGNNDVTLMLLLNEGYIVARAVPEQSYCGFDIMMWSKFEQMNGIKTALSSAVDSKIVSQYRIVVGGMFGLPSWQEEEQKRGPETARVECGSDSASFEKELPSNEGPNMLFVKATLSKISQVIGPLSADGSVVVLCKLEGQPCSSLNVLKEYTDFDLIPLWTCGNLPDEDDYTQDRPTQMFDCEKRVYLTLEEALIRRNRKVSAIIIDSDVSFTMGQIIQRLLSSRRNAHRWLDKDVVSVIAPFWGKRGLWRRSFVDALRKEVFITEPVFGSEVHLNSTTNDSLILILLKYGDPDFIPKLDDTLLQMEKDADFRASIVSFRGGDFHFQDNFHPTQSLSHEEFDNQDAAKQWHSQKPLGYQNIFQLQGEVENCASVAVALSNAMEKCVDNTSSSKTVRISASIGDGCLVTAHWSSGNSIATWDGRRHVDVNLYLADEDTNFARSFANAFATSLKLEVILRDIQPRGSGRLVSFRIHVDSPEEPHWTLKS